jgi:4-amino-4-deoxy-L-arabinose transferase-like glycosyltransferase
MTEATDSSKRAIEATWPVLAARGAAWERARPWLPLAGLLALALALNIPFLNVPIFWDGLWIVGGAEQLLKEGLRPTIMPAWDAEAHPILLHEILAAAWLVFGRSLWVTHLLIAAFACATLYATYRLSWLLYGTRAAIVATALLLSFPLFMAQSTVLVLDLPAAAFAMLALLGLVQRKTAAYLLFGTAMVLTKETTVLLVGVALLYLAARDARRIPWRTLALELAVHSLPIAALAAWMWYHVRVTGWLTTSELEPAQLVASYLPPALFRPGGVLATFAALAWDFLAKQFLIGLLTLFVVLAALSARPFLAIRRGQASPWAIGRALRAQPAWRAWGRPENIVLLGLPIAIHMAFMASNYGLHRYLLPEYALFFILAGRAVEWVCKRTRAIALVTAALAAIFLSAWARPWLGYSLSSPSNLMYLDFIQAHQQAAAFIERNYPDATVLTGWPQYLELGLPGAGYVARPIKVVAYIEKPPHEARIAAVGGRPFSDPRSLTLDDFDLLYYSEHTYGAVPTSQMLPELIRRFQLPLLAEFRKNGESVQIYANPRRVRVASVAGR